MTEEEKEQVTRFGIEVKQKSVYTYNGYEYDRLSDALNYAKIEEERRQTTDFNSG